LLESEGCGTKYVTTASLENWKTPIFDEVYSAMLKAAGQIK